jgi:hypothetical protein
MLRRYKGEYLRFGGARAGRYSGLGWATRASR